MTPLIIAQISDLHLRREGELSYGVVDTVAMLQRCVQHIAHLSHRPQLLLATGDLVDSGAVEEYQTLRRMLGPLAMPVYLVPGNHDDRAALRSVFPDQPWQGNDGHWLNYTVEQWPLRLVALDTVTPGEDGGRLCDERLAWLDATLAKDAHKPTLVAMHHPPFKTWIPGMDCYGLQGAGAFAAVIAKHPQVERIVCGHLHRHIEARVAGVPVSVCPSPAHQITLDLAPASRASFVMEPPGYLLHLWSGEEGLVTHCVPVGNFDGPYDF